MIIEHFDMIFSAMVVLSGIYAFKGGLLKEFLITLGYVPYMGLTFYLLNRFFQDDLASLDSIIYKLTALSGFYLGYIVLVRFAYKAFKQRSFDFNPVHVCVTKFLGGCLNASRTAYFVLLCLILFSLHVNKAEFLEKSKILTTMYPCAVATRDFLIEKQYLNNEIILYDEISDISGRNADELKRNALIKKLKNSETYKEMESKFSPGNFHQQVDEYLQHYSY